LDSGPLAHEVAKIQIVHVLPKVKTCGQPFPFAHPLAKVRRLGRGEFVSSGGLLFSDYFLRSGVEDLPEWNAQSPDQISAAKESIKEIVGRAQEAAHPNESVTEQLAIEPILRLLGWDSWLRQQSLSPTGRTDVPDYLLFSDQAAQRRAEAIPQENRRYRLGATFLEGKKWDVPLDRAAGATAPSTQMLRYLSLAEVQSDQRIRFAILTNGRVWRLYDQKARSRAEEFLEIDVALVADGDLYEDADRLLRLLLLFFSPQRFDATSTVAPSTSGRLAKAAVTRSESLRDWRTQSLNEFSAILRTHFDGTIQTLATMPNILRSCAKRR
jgi:hypothetical protein